MWYEGKRGARVTQVYNLDTWENDGDIPGDGKNWHVCGDGCAPNSYEPSDFKMPMRQSWRR